MDIKAMCMPNDKTKLPGHSAPLIRNPADSKPSSSAHGDDIDVTSSREGCDVVEVPIIRIPTGDSFLPDLKPGDCELGDNVSVIMTASDVDDPKEQVSDAFPHPHPYSDDAEDTDIEAAMVRVRRPSACTCKSMGGEGHRSTLAPMGGACPCGACREGQRERGTLTPVADLLREEGGAMVDAQVEAVPVEQHFYNQWARLPREEDPDRDVTSGTRRPASLRMLPATGSLKSYTLMNAIVRDKTSPIESYASLFSNAKPGAGAADGGGTTSPGRRGPGPSAEAQTTRPGGSRSAGVPGRVGENLLPILDLRAKTALGTVSSKIVHQEGCCSFQAALDVKEDRDYSGCLSSTLGYQDDHVCCCHGVDDKSLGIPGSVSGSLTSAGRRSKCSNRVQKSMSLNVASFLFSSDIHVRSNRHQNIIQKKRPRVSSKQNQTTKEDVRHSSKKNTNKSLNKDGGASTTSAKSPEMTSVQFIDLTEVKKLLLKDRKSIGDNDVQGFVASRGDILSAPSRRRLVCSAAIRHYGGKSFGKLYDGKNASVTLGMPLNISAIKSSVD